jgi:hypothetical protein
MSMQKAWGAVLGTAIGLIAASAMAQDMPAPQDPQSPGSARYDVHSINFDMWCQEERQLPAERCDKRLPQDDQAFQAYRAKIEKYEIPHLQNQRQQDDLNRGILHNDPVDHPTQPSQPPIQPTPTAPPPG